MDTARWYYLDGQEAVGPFLWDRLLELARAAIIESSTLVWREGEKEWVPLAGAMLSRQAAADASPLPGDHASSTLAAPGAAVAADAPLSAPSGAGTDIAESASLASNEHWSATPVAPWRRYGARMIDTTLHGVLGIVLIAYAWYVIAPASADAFFSILDERRGRLIDFMLSCLAAVIVGGFVVGSTGSSLGKAIFGVKVVNAKGEPIGIVEGFRRELQVWAFGMGLGIPIIALFTMSNAFSKLRKEGITSWDRRQGCLVLHRPAGPLQSSLNVVGIILIIGSLVLLRHLS